MRSVCRQPWSSRNVVTRVDSCSAQSVLSSTFRRRLSSVTTPLTRIAGRETLEWQIGPKLSRQRGYDHWNNHHGRISISAAVATAVAATFASMQSNEDSLRTTDCCGIVGVVGSDDPLSSSASLDSREFLLQGLTVLKNRGYDSAGLATLSDLPGSIMTITKFASDGEKADAIDLVRAHSHASTGHSIGMAHTRWATHGGKTDENAHPHTDSSGRIALVHNGTINNAHELRKELVASGHVFQGTTDSEVLAKLIGQYYQKYADTDKGKAAPSLVKLATEVALSRCDGSWGLCVMCADTPDELVVACNGSPMMIGVADGRTFVASETLAFSRYTKNFISMNDGEIGVLHADARTFDLVRTQRDQHDESDEKTTPPPPFEHWTLKEIYEQPESMARALSFGGRLSADKIYLGGIDANFDRVAGVQFATLAACGSSLNAARYGERLMKHLGSFDRIVTIDAAEFVEDDLPCTDTAPHSSGVIAISQSGETMDVLQVVQQAMDKDVTCLSIVNEVGSLIARTTKMGVYCNAGSEHGVTSTKGFTSQIVVLALLALWFRQKRDFLEGRRNNIDATELKEALMRLPISFGMALQLREQCHGVAQRLMNKEHCFVLGKGFGEPIAYEGALKIKEMSYLHAEGYSGGALKHGPFALIENDQSGKFGATPIIMLILDDQHAHHMRIAAEETKARGADLIIITDKAQLAEGLCDAPIVIPNNGPLTALGAILPLQLIAYELAVLRGINPDTPRNLSKVIISS